jgi:hypothetical protein
MCGTSARVNWGAVWSDGTPGSDDLANRPAFQVVSQRSSDAHLVRQTLKLSTNGQCQHQHGIVAFWMQWSERAGGRPTMQSNLAFKGPTRADGGSCHGSVIWSPTLVGTSTEPGGNFDDLPFFCASPESQGPSACRFKTPFWTASALWSSKKSRGATRCLSRQPRSAKVRAAGGGIGAGKCVGFGAPILPRYRVGDLCCRKVKREA